VIAGGAMTGKELTPAGKAGAYDFINHKGAYGSAKFYGKPRGIKQAQNGFEAIYNEETRKNGTPPGSIEVEYVIAIKKQGEEQIGTERGSSDPAKVVLTEIYMPIVSFDGSEYKVNGDVAKLSGGDVVLDTTLGTLVGTLRLASVRTETFRQYISKTIDKQKGDVVEAFKHFKAYYDALDGAEKSAKAYIGSTDPNIAQHTYNNISKAEKEFKGIEVLIKKENQPQAVMSESLDSLIESIINKKLLK
jgi:hypothetical protein